MCVCVYIYVYTYIQNRTLAEGQYSTGHFDKKLVAYCMVAISSQGQCAYSLYKLTAIIQFSGQLQNVSPQNMTMHDLSNESSFN